MQIPFKDVVQMMSFQELLLWRIIIDYPLTNTSLNQQRFFQSLMATTQREKRTFSKVS